MTYTPNVPQATQTIAQTQAPIFNNFTYIDDALQRDHTFNGNDINSEAAGYHQHVSSPNLGADVAALPTGIDAVMYAIGGNFFNYNGAKGPMSAVLQQGTINMTNVLQTLFTAPADSIGIATIFASTSALTTNVLAAYIFSSTSAGPPPPLPAVFVGALNIVPGAGSYGGQLLSATFSGLDFQVRDPVNAGPVPYYYKVIYWPM